MNSSAVLSNMNKAPRILPALLRQRINVHSSCRTLGSAAVLVTRWEQSMPSTSAQQPTQLQAAAFHTTCIRPFAVRRRRRGEKHVTDEEDDESKNHSHLQHTPVKESHQFVAASKALLDRLEIALQPMKATNERFIVERSAGKLGEVLSIDLGPKEGTYRVEFSSDDSMFEYSSPISGKILYILSSATGEWVGMEDGHTFEGILVRDLSRQCIGLPQL